MKATMPRARILPFAGASASPPAKFCPHHWLCHQADYTVIGAIAQSRGALDGSDKDLQDPILATAATAQAVQGDFFASALDTIRFTRRQRAG